ncbi:hypothetical protein OAK43_04375 [Verrucomicrobiales bacterium]|nr:hypothetical protein [Verrucomicrobiales bacterium]
MSAIDKGLVICGEHEIGAYRDFGITHVISVSNLGITASIPDWFEGDRMTFQFGDVISVSDAASLGTRAPDADDIRQAIDFFSRA